MIDRPLYVDKIMVYTDMPSLFFCRVSGKAGSHLPVSCREMDFVVHA